ncbi:5'-nucleotidase [Bacillus oleivorans]|uniref:5'-nucleotidase n=1 Tax=Bacillus oleivorans TaxID=1448271 RepID=A0A285CIE7_9BACI|nr:5'-nucleotidase C-terminal domain-containing protein [Bacillus oleivorans]SNX67364.1 5'-nucleotidase [Bacillus oleivorans]
MIKRFGKRVVSLAALTTLAVGTFFSPAGISTADAAETVKVQLLGLNDLHGRINNTFEEDYDGDGVKEKVGGLQYVASYFKEREAENPNTLLVHAGDMIGGSELISGAFQDEPVVEIMEEMGFDVGTLGNHEFDEGIAELQRMINGGAHPNGDPNYDGMNFPVVAANVFSKSTGELLVDPYAVKEVGGVKIGFIGVVTTETPNMIVKTGNEDLEIKSEVEAINKYVSELQAAGVEAIVVLAHNPVSQDGTGDNYTDNAAYIANHVNDAVDVIFAAHNHEEVIREIDNKLVIQAYEYSKAFSDVDLEIDPATGDIVGGTAEVVYADIEGVTADPGVLEIIEKYQTKVAAIENEYITDTAAAIEGGYATTGEVGDNALGNLIADGMAAEMDADFALMNGGGIRADLPAGEITYGDLYAVQPFGNYLVKFNVTGAELREIMNNQLSETYGPDYSISGFTYTWSERYDEVVDLLLPDGTPVDEDAEYSIVINNYMWDGDGIVDVVGGTYEEGPTDLDATINYMKSLPKPVTYEAEGRISEVQLLPSFTDVPARAVEDVNFLYNEGVVSGASETKFNSYGNVTRAEFAAMLVRGLGIYAEEEAPFKDIGYLNEQMQWEIAAAYEAGIVFGKSETEFAPADSIKREEMVAMLMRAFELVNEEPYVAEEEAPFTDLGMTNASFQAAIDAAYELGLINGFSEEKFAPKALTKRIDAASIVAEFLQY